MTRRRSRRLEVGIAQVPVAMGDKVANLRTIFRALDDAADARCDVAVFPECSLTGWCSPACRQEAERVPGFSSESLGDRARRRRMAVVIGLEEREGDRIYNSALFFDRGGRLLARHRKINELDIGLRLYAKGSSLGVFDFEGRRFGLDICADSWIPEITDALYFLGARLIFSPCAWAVRPGGEARNIARIREWYAARAKGKDLVIVSANGVGRVTQGPWRGRILQGESLVTGPGGRNLLQGPRNRPALLTVGI
jgi:predicted amidohydrolase